MTDTPEHDPAETTARPGLAGGAARALRAARQSAPTGSEAVETPAAETPAAETPADETPADETDLPADEADEIPPDDTADAGAAGSVSPAPDTTESVDPDAPPVLATVRAPKRKAAASKAVEAEPAETESTVLDLVAPEPKDTTRTRLLAVSATLTAAALVFAVIASVLWWRAGHDDDRDAAAARDDVAVDARLAIATVNTSDYRKPANALTNWIDVATGSLEKQFTTSRASATTLLAQAKKVTTATVLDVAVTKLDGRSASVIASVNVKQQPVTGAASTVRNRFRASMTKVGDEWKLADLAQVDVQLS